MKRIVNLVVFFGVIVSYNTARSEQPIDVNALSKKELNIVGDNTIFDTLKKAFYEDENTAPEFEDFNKLGEIDSRACTEVYEKNPDKSLYISVNLFTEHYSAQGPLIPPRTVNKVLVMENPRLQTDFNKFKMEYDDDYLTSVYEVDEDNHYETYIKKQGNLLIFKRRGEKKEEGFVAYGYCYHL